LKSVGSRCLAVLRSVPLAFGAQLCSSGLARAGENCQQFVGFGTQWLRTFDLQEIEIHGETKPEI